MPPGARCRWPDAFRGSQHQGVGTRPAHSAVPTLDLGQCSERGQQGPHQEALCQVFWGKVECGLILPSLSSWEVVTKQKGVTTGGYMCKYCKGFWKQGKGGSRFLQIIGRHKSKVAALQLVLDEPPQDLHNRWIKDRVEFYKRVEPLAPRDERLDLVGGPQNRLRFSTSNGLGVVSDALWTTILGNEEVSSLKMIHQVAMQHGRK